MERLKIIFLNEKFKSLREYERSTGSGKEKDDGLLQNLARAPHGFSRKRPEVGERFFLFDLGKTVSVNRISEESIPNVLDEK